MHSQKAQDLGEENGSETRPSCPFVCTFHVNTPERVATVAGGACYDSSFRRKCSSTKTKTNDTNTKSRQARLSKMQTTRALPQNVQSAQDTASTCDWSLDYKSGGEDWQRRRRRCWSIGKRQAWRSPPAEQHAEGEAAGEGFHDWEDNSTD